jgi:hypothetical protein
MMCCRNRPIECERELVTSGHIEIMMPDERQHSIKALEFAATILQLA